jgi:hypothetical protein
MRNLLILPAAMLALASCKQPAQTASTQSPLNGSWKLVNSKSIVKKDTTDTSPKKGIETIKLYNDDHFSFFTHNTMKMDTPQFVAGAGTYTLKDNNYTEHLQYCSAREWENHDFNFTLTIKNDTMQQRGVEKIDSLHVDHVIIETYVKIK